MCSTACQGCALRALRMVRASQTVEKRRGCPRLPGVTNLRLEQRVGFSTQQLGKNNINKG